MEFQADFLDNNPTLKALKEMFSYEIEAGSMEPMDPEIAARLVMGTVKTAWIEGIVLGNEQYAQRMEEEEEVIRMLDAGVDHGRNAGRDGGGRESHWTRVLLLLSVALIVSTVIAWQRRRSLAGLKEHRQESSQHA